MKRAWDGEEKKCFERRGELNIEQGMSNFEVSTSVVAEGVFSA
jgi:hypothetical protein